MPNVAKKIIMSLADEGKIKRGAEEDRAEVGQGLVVAILMF